MGKFKIDDTVKTKNLPHLKLYCGQIGSVINVFSKRPEGKHFEQFPVGTIYAVEFENGDAIDIHENDLFEVKNESDS
ncbi:hypothetical protein [Marisediminitalea sp.]|uniref:hypothetical protein n=1 Tax=Marisediminitalea sp. TaxID=2662268 RepID=UPI003375753E|nr:hypothetical protein [Aestuariibacter sp.]MCP4233241.1 hypothetical protein [Aestuariibacter sp.]MCP4524422.1 hypothetical protein [Aestuariibacter sp.]MCP4947600.1 hypothetical protein [Aestuariibacter sp.]MCP5010194.1 hypothetical protein [Aestuariibacter sp.]